MTRRQTTRRWPFLLLVVAMIGWQDAEAEAPPSVAASAGLDIAGDAARTWAPDAILVYVENDEDIDPGGTSARWGYLYYSPSLDGSRVYSVRDGRIVTAETPAVDLEMPPVSAEWIDSDAALAAADAKAGADFRNDEGGAVRTMLLIRGAFHDRKPDRTTWMVVYAAADVPALFVVVDASDGKVVRTWRG